MFALAALVVALSTPTPALRVKTVAVGRGNVRVGELLTAPRLGNVRRYQWLRCNGAARGCVAIKGATLRRYRVRRADVGHRLRVREDLKGNNTAISAPTGIVTLPLPVNTGLPTITDGGQGGGTLTAPVVGDVLTGSTGAWNNALRYTYQWDDCPPAPAACAPITGATSSTYTIQSSDVGDTIEFIVTAYNF